ncbi:hypothetical protein [Salinarimonas soli]|uniref:Uncharacterized protein n=1 Tax=Salinarimonas soli TaxID=1638099 RepID=A0A5B2VGB3_9HYPH|nr:hypothetical protein [Salinarimonas soli]KAA2237945.1 hypothetical protein F0L46_06640 [Salinarimonas soli]
MLAYELMISTILGDLGFGAGETARSWARFWICDPADAAASGRAARELTVHLMRDELPIAVVAQVHCRLAALEVRHLVEGGALDTAGLPDWTEASAARLVLLLASLEGERVCADLAAAAAPDRSTDHAVAALSEAARILNRSLGELRALPAAASRTAA